MSLDNIFYLGEIKYCVSYQTRFFIVMSSRSHRSSCDEERGEEDQLRTYGRNKAIQFDWTKRWLKGNQYNHILQNVELYCETFGFKKYEQKTHPKEIYSEPVNGMIYFVKGKGVGQDFGFPRMDHVKKKYRWKKMNFTTDLPKRKPFVTYVVASAMRANMIEQSQNAEFRMHAVIPYCQGKNASDNNEYILCHVRSVDQKKQLPDCTIKSCFVQAQVDFYRLFACLHNSYMESQLQ